jgi:hypothetical protein
MEESILPGSVLFPFGSSSTKEQSDSPVKCRWRLNSGCIFLADPVFQLLSARFACLLFYMRKLRNFNCQSDNISRYFQQS